MIADGGGTPAVAPAAAGGGGWAHACDSCWSAPCAVYCRADAAYLCAGCDARVHAANSVASRHERVWVCEGCKRAPAALTCRADAAVLCTACDADVHSANPLASRHRRVPVLPLRVPSLDVPPDRELDQLTGKEAADNDDEEAASWLLLDSVRRGNNESNAGFLFGAGDVDEYLDLDYNSGNENQNNNKDDNQLHTNPEASDQCIVPVPSLLSSEPQHKYEMVEMEYDDVSRAGFSYAAAASLSHSMSFSSKDASIVPDTTMTDVSNSYGRNYNKGTIDLFSSSPLQIPPQFTPMDREARVLRYREKKKMRKFEKTIRYASRKAYAETRPRIKGRFAKRSDVELEVDQLFSTALISDGSYSIVPSF